jgi:uncharacterized protein involved in exopolysaccharide biosynthesis
LRPLTGDQRIVDPKGESEYIDLADIIAFVRRRILLIVAFAVAGAATALFFASTTDPTYFAKTQILIEPKLPQQATNPAGGLAASLDTAQVESQIAVLRSEKIAKMVIESVRLIDEPDFFILRGVSLIERIERIARLLASGPGGDDATPRWLSDLLGDGGGDEAGERTLTAFERERIALTLFDDALDIRRVGVSYAIDIGFRSRNPDLAARIANAVADGYLREQVENKAAAARQSGDWLEERMGEMRRKMNTATQLAQEFRARHDYRIRSPRARLLNGQVVYDEAVDSEDDGPTLEELEVTADTYRKMYESFLLAYTNNLSQQSYPVADARVITAATMPLAPSAPRTKLLVAFGLTAGLVVGVGVAFVLHALDGAIRSAAQVRAMLGLPCLGELPPARRRGGANEVCVAPGSPFSAALRRAKFEIGLAAEGEPVRRIGLTSVAPREGKARIAGNLALLYAASGARTLLIDADIDDPVPSRGVAGAAPDSLGVIAKALGAVDLLPGHPVGGSEAHDLSRFDDYDVVVVSLPTLASGPDRLAQSATLDGVVIVAEWSRTSLDSAADLVSTLRNHDAKVLGVALSGVRQPSRRLYQMARQPV